MINNPNYTKDNKPPFSPTNLSTPWLNLRCSSARIPPSPLPPSTKSMTSICKGGQSGISAKDSEFFPEERNFTFGHELASWMKQFPSTVRNTTYQPFCWKKKRCLIRVVWIMDLIFPQWCKEKNMRKYKHGIKNIWTHKENHSNIGVL